MKLNVESEALLSEPGSLPTQASFDRKSSLIHVDEKIDGRNKPSQFSRQYCHAYTVRLFTVRPKLEEAIKSEWPNVEIKRIAELCEYSQATATTSADPNNGNAKHNKPSRKSDDHGQHIMFREGVTVAIIGTVFKYQPEKPSILQDLAEENPMVPVVLKTKYTSDKDTVQLEDETTRVQLVFTEECGLTAGKLVNGIVCSIKGRPTMNGKFEVIDVFFPTPSPPKPLVDNKMDIEIVFVSGMEFGCNKNLLQANLLFEYLEGLSGGPSEIDSTITKKTSVVFLGDTFGKPEGERSKFDFAGVARDIDQRLDQLSQTMNVLILPGENDPSQPMFPQAPIHNCLFPMTSRRPTFRTLSNPSRISMPISDKKDSIELDIILSSGQIVQDIIRNSETSSPLEVAENILRWGHLCPTAPDTLPLHPGVEDDVFVMDSLPHVFAVGSQETFEGTDWMGTKIIAVPKFSESGTAVLLTREMDLLPLNFKLL